MHSIKKNNRPAILIIRFSSIGDILLSTPLIAALRQTYPQAVVHYLTRKNYAPLLSGHPAIDRLITFDVASGFAGLRKLKKQLGVYDIVLDIHNNLRSHFLFPFQPHRNLTIFRMKKNKFRRFLLVKTGLNFYKYITPVWQKYLQTADSLNLQQQTQKMSLYLPPELPERKEIESLAKGKIIVAAGARHFTKRWPAEYFIELLGKIHKKYGRKSLLVGGPGEVEIANQITRTLGSEVTTALAGKYSLLQTAAIIQNGSMLITNDSGLMHVAACFQKPTLAVFGSTVKELGFFPLNKNALIVENNGLSCRPCSHIGRNKCPKKHFKCMKEILPSEVLLSIEKKGWI